MQGQFGKWIITKEWEKCPFKGAFFPFFLQCLASNFIVGKSHIHGESVSNESQQSYAMAAIPVLRFRVRISPAGGFVDVVTANGNFPNLSISGSALPAVIAILNGRNPTYDPGNNGFSSTGGVGHEATEHIVALTAGGDGGNDPDVGEGHIL